MTDLDEATRARIRAEEAERLRVRGELAAQERQRTRPSYWTGFILNALVFGLGFFVIGEVAWGVIWLIAAVVLNLSTSFIAWPFLAVGVLAHYRTAYAKKYGTGPQMAHITTNHQIMIFLGVLLVIWALIFLL